jgi:hypothetical protein
MPNFAISTQHSAAPRRLETPPFAARPAPPNAVASSSNSAAKLVLDRIDAEILKPIRHAVRKEHEQLYTETGTKIYEHANGANDWFAARMSKLGYLGNNDALNRIRKRVNDEFNAGIKIFAEATHGKQDEYIDVDPRHSAVALSDLRIRLAAYTMAYELDANMKDNVLRDMNGRIRRLEEEARNVPAAQATHAEYSERRFSHIEEEFEKQNALFEKKLQAAKAQATFGPETPSQLGTLRVGSERTNSTSLLKQSIMQKLSKSRVDDFEEIPLNDLSMHASLQHWAKDVSNGQWANDQVALPENHRLGHRATTKPQASEVPKDQLVHRLEALEARLKALEHSMVGSHSVE